jgi:tetratricopeptide (TPR) repeat protein
MSSNKFFWRLRDRMKFLLWPLIFALSFGVFAQNSMTELPDISTSPIYKEAVASYQAGKYQTTIDELKAVEIKISSTADKMNMGFLSYWMGVCYNRIQDYPLAIENFEKALGVDYRPEDIHYEYGQALFASEKLSEARLQFRESLKRKFKRAVSLYYIAYISKELGEKKKAVTFYRAIDKLDASEAKEVQQAAEMQVGDIYLEQVEKHPDSFQAVENYVIPQYKRALNLNKESRLAFEIANKIRELEQKYDLVLLKLRNGRPTLVPAYFSRLALEVGSDSNVTFAPSEQSVAESKKRSLFTKTDLITRYTLYHEDFISFAPELRFNYTRYLNREPEIYRNDNYLIAPAFRTAYEHKMWNQPAATLFDYDYADARRDINEREKLEFSFRSHTLMIGEKFNYFPWGESIVRLRHRVFDSFTDASDSKTTSLVFEQVRNFLTSTLLIYSSIDMSRVKEDIYDTNSFTVRGDLLMARIRDWFSPSFGLGITRTNPFNDSIRGIEYMINPSARVTKAFDKNWRSSLKFDYQRNKSDDRENFDYEKYIYSLEIEYLF